MNFNNYFTYNESDNLSFSFPKNSFVTFLGEGNKRLVDNLLFKNSHEYITLMFAKINSKNIYKYKKSVSFVLHEHLNLFVGETVSDEIAFGMECLGKSKNEMEDKISTYANIFGISNLLDKDPNCVGISDKVKIKIVGALVCEPKILVLDEVLCELDKCDLEIVVKKLKDFVKNDNIIFNFTSDINECLYGTDVIVLNNEKVLVSGKTINVLNEDKLMKKLGFGLPFLTEINKYLIDYGIVNRYFDSINELVDEVWK